MQLKATIVLASLCGAASCSTGSHVVGAPALSASTVTAADQESRGPESEAAVSLESLVASLHFDPSNTALVVTDPQNDFLSPDGVAWGVVGASVTENNTVLHIDQLFAHAKAGGYPVFVSPHYYFPHDHHWHFEGELEGLMHKIGMFDRPDALSLEGFEGSGADWLARYKKYIDDGETVVTSPHKVYGPETNDLVLQLRKRGIDRVILAGMSANLCTESHMRELLEQGFDVTVVSDATAAAVTPGLGDGYAAAVINFGFMANAVVSTEQALVEMKPAMR